MKAGFTVSKIAKDGLLGATVHRNTINNFMKLEGMVLPRKRYSPMTPQELEDKVRDVHSNFPKSGYRDVHSMLASQGQRLTYFLFMWHVEFLVKLPRVFSASLFIFLLFPII